METGIHVVRRRLIQNKEAARTPLWPAAVFAFLSLASLTELFAEAFSIPFIRLLVYPVQLFYSVFFTWYYETKKLSRYRIFTAFGLILLLCVIAFFMQEALVSGFCCTANGVISQINRTYQGKIGLSAGAGKDASAFFLMVSVLMEWFLAQGMIRRRDRGCFLFLAFPVCLFAFLGGGTIRPLALTGVFVCLLWNFASSRVRVREKLWSGESSLDYGKNKSAARRVSYLSAAFAAVSGVILLAAAFYLIRPITAKPIVRLSDAAAPVKKEGLQVLYDLLPKISGGRLGLSLEGVGGGVSDGGLGEFEGASYDGVEALRVTSSVQPQEILYLKGFIGSEYAADSWKPADEKRLSDAVLNWKTEGNALLYIQNLPFLRMMYAQNAQPAQLTVERLNANTNYTYVPYQAYLNDYYEIAGGDGAILGQSAQDDSYAWFSTSDYAAAMEEWNKNTDDHGHLDDLMASYEAYVKLADTEVPDGLDRLVSLCSEKKKEWDDKVNSDMTKEQLSDLEQEKIADVKQFVIRTLWEQCEFSQSAVKLPEGEDFIEYFLFDAKKGDATAFASAAAMMFRICGIPARYVVGYAAPANLFTPETDGTYTAVLQDDNAHAWAEIFLPDVGWTPVETTPGFAGTVDNLTMQEPDSESVVAKEQKPDAAAQAKKLLLDTGHFVVSRSLSLFLSLIVLIVLFYVRMRVIRKKRRGYGKKYTQEVRVRVIFASFYEVLTACGFPQEIDTTDETFAGELLSRYPVFDAQEVRAFMEIVLNASFGYRKTAADDTKVVRAMYEKLLCAVKKECGWSKRAYFCIWKAF